jgi:putative flippase GtrA
LLRGAVDARVQTEIVNADRNPALRSARMSRVRERIRVAWFIVVGCAAAGVHFGVVVLLVTHAGWPPLVANVGGWLVAFGVSFAGHHRFSFHRHTATLRSAAGRFFAISAAGFALNEAAYAALLHWGGLGYELGLALVLLAVAVATYGASRHWAFLRN